MKRLVLGVVGHVDHGKTALVRALTGMETDRLAEEKRRGISIALGFAHALIDGGQVDFVDAPGHERFVRTLVGGVTGADAVLLVVAANEGVKPQTREHLTIAALLGVKTVLVAVSKCDAATPEQVSQSAAAAVGVARELGLEAATPIATSAVTGEGLDVLRAAIGDLLTGRVAPAEDGFAYLPLDRAFLMPGQGVVATGTLRRGTLSSDDAVELLPVEQSVRIRRLQVHGVSVAAAEPGQRVAVNLRGIELDQLPRGTVLASAGGLTPSEWLTVRLRAAPDAPPLANGARLDLLIGAALASVTVRLLEADSLEAGETQLAQLRAQTPIAAPARDGFVLRTASPAATVAGGEVIDPVTRRLRRGETDALARLRRLADAAPAERAVLAVQDAAAAGVGLGRLAQLSGLSPAVAAEAAAANGAVRLKGGVVISRPVLAQAQAEVLAILGGGAAVPSRSISERAPGVGSEVLDAVLSALVASGRARAEGGRFALVRASEDRARAEAGAALAARFARLLLDGGLSPVDLIAQARSVQERQALDALVRQGLAVRTYDRVQKREILFHRQAIEAARRTLASKLEEPGLTVSEAGQILAISRKFSVPLLEHLDAIGFTRRRGDRRILADAVRSVSPAVRGGD